MFKTSVKNKHDRTEEILNLHTSVCNIKPYKLLNPKKRNVKTLRHCKIKRYLCRVIWSISSTRSKGA